MNPIYEIPVCKAIKGGGIALCTEGRILTSDGCSKGTMAMRKEESKMARPRKRNRKENRFSVFLAVIVVILLTTMVGFKSIGLKQKRDQYLEEQTRLTRQIQKEEARSQEIAEYEKYTHTRKYIEEVARDKLGLIYEGEILFRNE